MPAAAKAHAPLVLLHEGLGSLGLWRDVPDRLASATGRAVLVWSRHGHGRSGPEPTRPRPVTYMHQEALAVLPELLDCLRLSAPVLIGHSDGASIALIYAGAGRPVSGVVALAPHVIVEDRAIEGIEGARDAYLHTDLPERMGRHHDDAEGLFWAWNDVWLSPEFRTWNIESYLPAISVPVLVVQSADDEYGTMDQVARIETATPGPVRTVAAERGGHSLHQRDPDLVLGAITDWLTEVA